MARIIRFGIGEVLVAHGIDEFGTPVIGLLEASGSPEDIGTTPPNGPELMEQIKAEGVVLAFHSLAGVKGLLDHLEAAAVLHNKFVIARDSVEDAEN